VFFYQSVKANAIQKKIIDSLEERIETLENPGKVYLSEQILKVEDEQNISLQALHNHSPDQMSNFLIAIALIYLIIVTVIFLILFTSFVGVAAYAMVKEITTEFYAILNEKNFSIRLFIVNVAFVLPLG